MRESRTYGSVRGALSNERPYRDKAEAHQVSSPPLPHVNIDIEIDILDSGLDGAMRARRVCWC